MPALKPAVDDLQVSLKGVFCTLYRGGDAEWQRRHLPWTEALHERNDTDQKQKYGNIMLLCILH